MKVIHVQNLNSVSIDDDICAAVGNFDGVHLGHQKLLIECKNHNLKSAVLTFYPHPATFIKDIPNYPVLTTLEHKISLIKNMDIDYLIIVDFNDDMARIDKVSFIKFMHEMRIKKIVCGYDFTFGYKALGTTSDLQQEFDTYIIPKYVINDVRVSTTHIKELISNGSIDIAKIYLGRYYSIIGKVIHGNNVGSHLGFPTANVDYQTSLLPKNGVYFVSVLIGEAVYYGMANIGYNPTLNFSEDTKLEVHIFDFKEDIYDSTIEIVFLQRIRSEKKFDNKKHLINQLKQDMDNCLNLKENFKNK